MISISSKSKKLKENTVKTKESGVSTFFTINKKTLLLLFEKSLSQS